MKLRHGIFGWLVFATLVGSGCTTSANKAETAAAATKAEALPSKETAGQPTPAPSSSSAEAGAAQPSASAADPVATAATATASLAGATAADAVGPPAAPVVSPGFGKFMKKAAPVAGVLPMAGMAGGMTGAVAGQAASVAAMAAVQTAQEQAMNQLAGFNGQIKSKDDVTVGYQLLATGQDKPQLQNALNGKAKSDGEDVLTPLILKAADTILWEVAKKQF